MRLRLRPALVYGVVTLSFAASACGGSGGGPTPNQTQATTFALSGLGTVDANGTYELAAATPYTVGAKETVNGQTVATGTLTIVPSTSALGVVSGDTLKTGLANASGTLKVVDSKTGLGATISVDVLTTLPLSSGNTLSLSGTSFDSLTIAQPPSPDPSPIITNGTFRVDESVVSTDASFGGTTGLAEIGLTETDVVPAQTVTTTTTLYAGFVPAGDGDNLRVYGYHSSDSTGVTTDVTYGADNGVIETLPAVTEGAFTNAADETFTEHDPDGTVANRTVAADGTYVETDTFAGGTQTIRTNADFSASITGLSGLPIDVTFSAPMSAPPGALNPTPMVAYTITSEGSQLASGSIEQWWYTGTPIFSDQARKRFSVGLDPRCTFPVSLQTTPTLITEDQVVNHLDTALGTSESRHITLEEIAGYGTICASYEDGLDTFIDYSGASQPIVSGVNVALSADREPFRQETAYGFANFVDSSVEGAGTTSAAARFSRGLTPDEALRLVTPLSEQRLEVMKRAQRFALLRRAASRRVERSR